MLYVCGTNFPEKSGGMLTIEMIFGVQDDEYNELKRAHVWGCPAYVLETALLDGRKIPKWNPRSQREQFLGFFTHHASTTGLICNMVTRHISAQFHVVYNDFFTFVLNAENGGLLEGIEWTRNQANDVLTQPRMIQIQNA